MSVRGKPDAGEQRAQGLEGALRKIQAEVDEFYAGECDCYPEDGAICILHRLGPIFERALADPQQTASGEGEGA